MTKVKVNVNRKYDYVFQKKSRRSALLSEQDRLNAYLRVNPLDSKATARLAEVTAQLYL